MSSNAVDRYLQLPDYVRKFIRDSFLRTKQEVMTDPILSSVEREISIATGTPDSICEIIDNCWKGLDNDGNAYLGISFIGFNSPFIRKLQDGDMGDGITSIYTLHPDVIEFIEEIMWENVKISSPVSDTSISDRWHSIKSTALRDKLMSSLDQEVIVFSGPLADYAGVLCAGKNPILEVVEPLILPKEEWVFRLTEDAKSLIECL